MLGRVRRRPADRADAVNAGELARQDVGPGDGLRLGGGTDTGSGSDTGPGTDSTETGQGSGDYGAGLPSRGASSAHDSSSAHDIGSAYGAGSARDAADDEYSGEDGYPAGDRYSTADPLAGTSATPDSSVASITESDGDEGLKPGDVLSASALTDVESLPEVEREVETVPF